MNRRIWRAVLTVTVLVGILISIWNQKVQAIEFRKMDKGFYELSEKVATPHIPWAKPYYKGKVKVLVVAPGGTQRETIELAERLSIDYVTVFTSNMKELGIDPAKVQPYALVTGTTLEEKEKELREKLKKDYDVIIIGKFHWNAFSKGLKYEILKKVANGTGLIFSPMLFGAKDEILNKVLSEKVLDTENLICSGIPFKAV